jgi:hypothetical protein
MQLFHATSLLVGLSVMGKAVSMSCHDAVGDSCTNFCLSPMGNHVRLGWYGIHCTQTPCDIAALADEALATTDSVDYAKFHCNHLEALPDFGQCDGFVCGEIYGCKYSDNNVDDLCYGFHADHIGQVCVSPSGLRIFSSFMVFASYGVPDYSQAGMSCEVGSTGEASVTFARDVRVLESAADIPYCEDSAAEQLLAADFTSLVSRLGQTPAAADGARMQATDAAASVQDATIGVVVIVTAVLFLVMTPAWL